MIQESNLVSDASTEIGDIAGVADVTIRQSYRLIYPRAAELFPPDFKFDTPVDKLPQLWGRRSLNSADIFLLYLQDCFFLLNHICVGFGRFLLSLPKTSKPLSRRSHRNKTDTFQCLNKQLADCTYSISFECIYCIMYICPSGKM